MKSPFKLKKKNVNNTKISNPTSIPISNHTLQRTRSISPTKTILIFSIFEKWSKNHPPRIEQIPNSFSSIRQTTIIINMHFQSHERRVQTKRERERGGGFPSSGNIDMTKNLGWSSNVIKD